MKWFKHMTSTIDDEKISRLIDLAGLEGYGFFWRIIEIVASQIEKDSSKFQVKYSQNRIGILTFSHGNKVKKLLRNLQETSLIDLEITEENGQIFYIISCPNILKYRDEWTSRMSKTRELVGTKTRVAPEEKQKKIQIQNEEEEKTKNPPQIQHQNSPLPPGEKTAIENSSDRNKLAESLGKIQTSDAEMLVWQALKKIGCSLEDVEKARKRLKKNNLSYLKDAVCEERDAREACNFDPVEYFGKGITLY